MLWHGSLPPLKHFYPPGGGPLTMAAILAVAGPLEHESHVVRIEFHRLVLVARLLKEAVRRSIHSNKALLVHGALASRKSSSRLPRFFLSALPSDFVSLLPSNLTSRMPHLPIL